MATESFPVLTTERLVLRRLLTDDAQGVYRLRSDEEYCRYTRMKRYDSIERVFEYIKKIQNDNMKACIVWTITLIGIDKHIGSICLWNYSEDGKRAEIGYDLLPEYRGLGIASEAAKAVIARAFDFMGFDTVFADLLTANTKSVQLLERVCFVNKAYHLETDDNGQLVKMALYEIKR